MTDNEPTTNLPNDNQKSTPPSGGGELKLPVVAGMLVALVVAAWLAYALLSGGGDKAPKADAPGATTSRPAVAPRPSKSPASRPVAKPNTPHRPVCVEGERALYGRCVPEGTCLVADDCAEGGRCIAGQCTTSSPDAATCAADSDCLGDERCQEQRCQPLGEGPVAEARRSLRAAAAAFNEANAEGYLERYRDPIRCFWSLSDYPVYVSSIPDDGRRRRSLEHRASAEVSPGQRIYAIHSMVPEEGIAPTDTRVAFRVRFHKGIPWSSDEGPTWDSKIVVLERGATDPPWRIALETGITNPKSGRRYACMDAVEQLRSRPGAAASPASAETASPTP